MDISVNTTAKRQIIDLTDEIVRHAAGRNGSVLAFVKHTTAAITTADLDPGTDQDLLDALDGLLPELEWRHPHNPDHTPDHLLASIIGPDIIVPIKDGELQLGTWQRIILLEFDGPRNRDITLTFLPA